MNRGSGNSGFTLLEVMVALTLIAVALTGAISVLRNTIRNQDHLEQRLFALRVADTVAEQYRLEPLRFAAPDPRGTQTVLGRSFNYAMKIEAIDGDGPGKPPTQRVSITVTASGSPNHILARRLMTFPVDVERSGA